MATFVFKKTALCATQPKLYSMFCDLILKIENIGNIWFQQDGATCHTAEATLDVLRFVLDDRIISLATSELRFDTVGQLFVGCRQR